jgi:hypothetical protein
MKKWVLLLMAAFGLTISSAQSNLSISGTVFARAGSSLQGVYVVACQIVNDSCDDAGTKAIQPNATGSSLKYSIAGLAAKDYLMLAWRDLNKNEEVDSGDELGVYQKNGKPSQIRPSAQNIDLKLVLFNGDFDTILDQADQPNAASAPSSSGGVTPLSCSTNIFWECKVPVTPTSDCPVTTFPSISSEVGVYKGFVYGFCGRPLANYQVVLWSSISRGKVKTTFTDAKGFYRFDVRGILGCYVGISVEGNFAAKTYSYYVDPIDEVIGADGAVQNFNFDTRKSELRFVTYGYERYSSIPDDYTLELRLEPVALLDGSRGAMPTLSIPMKKTTSEFYLKGVKLGTYKMTVEIVTSSGRFWTFLDTFGRSGQPPAKTQTVTFISPDSVSLGINLE